MTLQKGLTPEGEKVWNDPCWPQYGNAIGDGTAYLHKPGISFGQACVKDFVAAMQAKGIENDWADEDIVQYAINQAIALCNALGGEGGGE